MLDSVATSSGQVFRFDVDSLYEAYAERFGPHPKVSKENQGLVGRVKRALSWIARAKNLSDARSDIGTDLQGEFIGLWISFNALYGSAKKLRRDEWMEIDSYLGKIVQVDGDDLLVHTVLKCCKKKVGNILKDEFLWGEYWETEDKISGIRKELNSRLSDCYDQEGNAKIEFLLKTLFGRIYFLRNMKFHGNTTDRRSPIKDSLRDAVEVLDSLTRSFVLIMVRKAKPGDWNPLPFPWKDSPQHPSH